NETSEKILNKIDAEILKVQVLTANYNNENEKFQQQLEVAKRDYIGKKAGGAANQTSQGHAEAMKNDDSDEEEDYNEGGFNFVNQELGTSSGMGYSREIGRDPHGHRKATIVRGDKSNE
ncbi:hypothetical protein HK099_001326, partial [Clydaea vesicula]